MTGIITYLSILTLNVPGLNSPIKRHQLAEWIKRKTQQLVVYKKPILKTETNIALGRKGGRRLPS
jgi:hypothetical protein